MKNGKIKTTLENLLRKIVRNKKKITKRRYKVCEKRKSKRKATNYRKKKE